MMRSSRRRVARISVTADHVAHATCSDGIAANWFSNLLAWRGSASSPHQPHFE